MSADTSIIKKFGYKNYFGTYNSRFYRIWQISWFNLRERIWNQKSVLATFGILLFLSFIVMIPIAVITASGSGIFIQQFFQASGTNLMTIFGSSLALVNYTLMTNPLTFILFGFIGGKIISEDIEYRSLEQYYLRVRRTDYLIGKFIALFLSYFLSTFVISFMFYYFLSNAFNFGLFELDSLIVLLKVVVFIFILTLTSSLFMLQRIIFIAAESDQFVIIHFIEKD